MSLAPYRLSDSSLHVLRHCYKFVSEQWQHMPRDGSPDQGFESKFRETCILRLRGWIVSQHREMNLGMGLLTASGVLHEIDIVAQREPTIAIFELKNKIATPPGKNDVVTFFAKILDYLCLTPALLRAQLVPTFIASQTFEQSALAACLGLGIHPIAPDIRPLPMLVDNAIRMSAELDRGLQISNEEINAFYEFRSALLNFLASLRGTDANDRFDYFDDLTIAVHAFGPSDCLEAASTMRDLNSQCTRLLGVFRSAAYGGPS